jgi:hypothetical protein
MIGIYIIFITHKFTPNALYIKGESGISACEDFFKENHVWRHHSWESITTNEKTYVELFLNLEEDQRD